jgi:hypothetical protein
MTHTSSLSGPIADCLHDRMRADRRRAHSRQCNRRPRLETPERRALLSSWTVTGAEFLIRLLSTIRPPAQITPQYHALFARGVDLH